MTVTARPSSVSVGLGLNLLEAAHDDRWRQRKVNYVSHGDIAIVATQGVALCKNDIRQKATSFEHLCYRTTSEGSSHLVTLIGPGHNQLLRYFSMSYPHFSSNHHHWRHKYPS